MGAPPGGWCCSLATGGCAAEAICFCLGLGVLRGGTARARQRAQERQDARCTRTAEWTEQGEALLRQAEQSRGAEVSQRERIECSMRRAHTCTRSTHPCTATVHLHASSALRSWRHVAAARRLLPQPAESAHRSSSEQQQREHIEHASAHAHTVHADGKETTRRLWNDERSELCITTE